MACSGPVQDNDEWTWGSVKRTECPNEAMREPDSEEEKVETRSTSYFEVAGEKASAFDQRRRHDGGLQASATKNRSHHAEAEDPMLSTLTEHDDSVKEEQDMPLAPIVSPRNLGTERVVTAPYPPEAPRKQVDVKSQIRTSATVDSGGVQEAKRSKELEYNGTQQLSTVPREVGTSDSESKRRYMDRITPQERTRRMERE
ncbi:hypothetical protein JG688_00014856 [Phytophthora aleatoria]|uniref:Uncharacterized protein n=1 Tax=Phytophthora aleatoria TaxID=2496075 RepID=A0A8J5M322_9STRA|nr:hypothetical protein JG688_00014856 [Phytophthora aleatoria]